MSSWIGVDLDGTLAHYEGWEVNHNKIGEPVQPMLRRVIDWLNNHQEVRIFTARVSAKGSDYHVQVRLIQEWCLKHIGKVLPITCMKDFYMVELWDDRAVTVQRNTGRVISDEYREGLRSLEAAANALRERQTSILGAMSRAKHALNELSAQDDDIAALIQVLIHESQEGAAE